MTAAQRISRLFKSFLIVVIILAITWILVSQYEFIFKKTVTGEVYGIDRVSQPTAILGSAAVSPEVMFSFAVAIKQPSGEIFTASSEDRQWAVVKKGDCAEVIFYPYPPWNLDKADTYHNARLKKLMSCDQMPKVAQ